MKKNPSLGRAVLLATTFLWGTSFVIQKNTLDNINTLYLLAIRFSIATILIGAVAAICIFKLKTVKLDRGYIVGGVLMGLCLIAAYILQTYGLVFTTPGKNAFLTSSYCILTPFLFWIIFKIRPEKKVFFAAVLCIIGIGFISLDKEISFNVGDLLTLLCGIFYSLHIVVIDKFAAGKNAAVITAIQFATAAIVAWIAALLFAESPEKLPSNAIISVIYLGVICTATCFFLQTFGQQNTPPSQAAILMTLEAVFGTAISVVFYKEKLTPKLFFGFALMLLSVIISETDINIFHKKRRKPNKTSKE